LARKDFSGIAKKIGTDPDSIKKAAAFISNLEPNPARDFSSSPTQYITPEIYVLRDKDDYRVFFDHDSLPELRINRRYREIMEDKNIDAETKKYIRERIHSGEWLIDNIRQRRETLRLLAEEIVRRQREFLDRGSKHLKPMKMSEVAEKIGRHESTVSRAVANKYINTPGGVFPLRYFFTSSLSGSNGEDISSVKAQQIIRELIAAEKPNKPLSDQELVRQLDEKGIKLARRTVAKYREQMGIPSTRMRREH